MGSSGSKFSHSTNDFELCVRSSKELEHIYESARRSRLCYASWLTPFDLHVTPAVSLRCQQCYARDPHAATTAFAVAGAFVPRAAAPPRRFFAEPAP